MFFLSSPTALSYLTCTFYGFIAVSCFFLFLWCVLYMSNSVSIEYKFNGKEPNHKEFQRNKKPIISKTYEVFTYFIGIFLLIQYVWTLLFVCVLNIDQLAKWPRIGPTICFPWWFAKQSALWNENNLMMIVHNSWVRIYYYFFLLLLWGVSFIFCRSFTNSSIFFTEKR